jgi:hypothetical protein
MRNTLAPQRTSRPGATVDLAVLASGRRSTIGVDLASGAFVRAAEPPRSTLFAPFTVVTGTTIATTIDRPEQPELLQFARPLEPMERLNGRRVERLIKPLLHPHNRPLLGFHGPSALWWDLEHSGSVALVEPQRGPVVATDDRGVRCHFAWSGHRYDLPLEDVRLLSRLDWLPNGPCRPKDLVDALGFAPNRLVIALGRPNRGYCPKVVAGLLPRP